MNEELYISRSTGKCIETATRHFTANIKHILRRTWPLLVVYAIALTLLCLIYKPSMAIHSIGVSHPYATFLVMTAIYLLCIAAGAMLIASTFACLNHLPIKKLVAKGFVCVIVLILCAMLLISLATGSLKAYITIGLAALHLSENTTTLIGWAIILGLITFLGAAMLPFSFSCTRFIAEENAKLRNIVGLDYRIGWRHWGFLVGTNIVAIIVFALSAIIALAPFGIILLAQISNQLGMLDGDPDGTPLYFFPLLIVTTLLSMFILALEEIWLLTVQYYAYGSIVKQETERQRIAGFKQDGNSKVLIDVKNGN